MFVGHIGAALAIGRVERRVNVGVFIAAAFTLDLALWIFVLLGVESVSIPADFASTHQPEYMFPYSHGLLASLAWSVLAGIATFAASARLQQGRLRAAVFVGAAVFSHWLLDALVHVPELPITGTASTKVGLALWQNMPVALGVEVVVVLAGLWLFIQGNRLSRAKAVSLTMLCLLLSGFTVVGMTIAPPPPSAIAMAATSLATLVIVCALVIWIGRLPNDGRA
ncbi:MAG: hypothetical protein ABIT36_04630 [Steroidobacteraceae bacterium]